MGHLGDDDDQEPLGAGATTEAGSPGDRAGAVPVVVVSAVALSEKVPDPALRPHAFTLRVGELLDLDEVSADLVAAGYERVDQVEDRGQFAVRGGLLDVFPATEDHAVRVDLFDIEIESLRQFSTFTQRSLGELQEVEIAPAAELAAEHRELAEIAALNDAEDRPDVAELLPTDRFRDFLDLLPEGTAVMLAAEEEVAPALADHWQDVTAAFHDDDAHQLYVGPDAITADLDSRATVRLSSLQSDQELAFHAASADTAARSLAEARFAGAPEGLKMACGENPKRVYGSKGRMPSTTCSMRAGFSRDATISLQFRHSGAPAPLFRTDMSDILVIRTSKPCLISRAQPHMYRERLFPGSAHVCAKAARPSASIRWTMIM